MAFTDEQLLPEGLAAVVIEAEQTSVRLLLESLSEQMDEVRAILSRRTEREDDVRNPLVERVRQAASALHLAGVHRLRDCVPFLREWEALNVPSMWMGSTAMTGRWWLQTQPFRPIVHHALKLLGEEPQGFPTYGFMAGEFDSPERFPMPERLADWRGRAASVDRKMSAEDVLGLLGSPDFMRRRSREVGRFYKWSENWEYDSWDGTSWTTLRMTWEEDCRRSRITVIEEVASYWLGSDEREAEFLRF